MNNIEVEYKVSTEILNKELPKNILTFFSLIENDLLEIETTDEGYKSVMCCEPACDANLETKQILEEFNILQETS